MSFGVSSVAPLLADFLADHPGIEIDLSLSDARVDIVAEGFDIALRIADLPDSSLRARRLCSIAAHIVAAPAYLPTAGTPTHPGRARRSPAAQLFQPHRAVAVSRARTAPRCRSARAGP